MNTDTEAYPIDCSTNYDKHSDHKLGINGYITYNWVKKDQENPVSNNEKKVDCLAILDTMHTKYLIRPYDDNQSSVLDETMYNLISKFTGFRF